MFPRLHNLRVAAQIAVDTWASAAATQQAPRSLAKHIPKARLQQFRYPETKGEIAVPQVGSSKSVDETATQKSSLPQQALTLDCIRRTLSLGSKLATMSTDRILRAPSLRTKVKLESDSDRNLRPPPKLTAKVKLEPGADRPLRSKVKLEPEDGIAKDPRTRHSKPKLPPFSAGDSEEVDNTSVKGRTKQQAKGKAFRSQLTKKDGVVKAEPGEEIGPRRRKLQSDVFTDVKKVKLEEDLGFKGKTPARQNRKTSENVSAGATPSEKASVRKLSTPKVQGPALGLEVVELRPAGSGAQLGSGEASAITTLAGPYPTYARPHPEECQQAKDLLSALHGHMPEYERHKVSCPTIEQTIEVQPLQILDSSRRHVNETSVSMQLALAKTASSEIASRSKGHPRDRRAVLDSLIGTLLSQNTTDNNSRKAFASLKSAFPTWEDVLRADPKKVQDAIRCGGLAEIKAERICGILGTLLKERGEVSMEYIRSMSNEDIKVELSRFKGVGPKTVACVLMFHLQRKEFPVDTHVFRISKMLGWVPEQADREKAYLHLNQRIPDALKFDIHCLFVTHGKRCPKCAKRTNQQPADGECPLLNWKSKWQHKSSDKTAIVLY